MRRRATFAAVGLLCALRVGGELWAAQPEKGKPTTAKPRETEISLEKLRPLFSNSIQDKQKWAEQFCFAKLSPKSQACAAVAIREPMFPGPTSMQTCRGSTDMATNQHKVANNAALEKAEERVKPGRAIIVCTP